MTRHLAPEQRIREILDAAADEIDENGLPALTMDAVAARTSLSKGGVYRFFRNKRELCVALLGDILERWTAFDVDEALAWGLTGEETLLRLILPPEVPLEGPEVRDWRVWLQLLPESLRDPELAETRRRHREDSRGRYLALTRGLLARDGLGGSDLAEQLIEEHLDLGLIFMEGITVLSAGGETPAALREALRHFVQTLATDVLKKVSA